MPTGEIPPIGLGTWQNKGPQCAESVETALNTGYRHVDTAQLYGNEKQVGKGMAQSDIPREDVTLATKVWTDKLTHDAVLNSTAESLAKLGTNYVDILYVHWPADTYDAAETLAAFDQLVDDGKVKHIAVSNFTPDLVDEARRHADHPILANQIEMHPMLPQKEMQRYCIENDLYLVAYSPLARGRALDLPDIQEIAEEHDATPAQVTLAWLLSKPHTVPIPKATSRKHIEENLAALELDLTDEDIHRIDELGNRNRLIDPPGLAPW